MSLSATALAQSLAVGTMSMGAFWSGALIKSYTLRPRRQYKLIARPRQYAMTAYSRHYTLVAHS